jgi:RND family efflux transporter MFP subunit
MKSKKVIVSGIFILLVAGVAIFAVKRKQAELAKAKPLGANPIPVSVAVVKKGRFLSEKQYVGVISPLNAADISSRITANITDVLFREGKIVKKGDLLIKLDSRNLVQAIAVLKAKAEGIKTEIIANNVNIKSLTNSVKYWQKQKERDKQLFTQKVIPSKQLELSEEKVNEIEGNLDVATQKNKTLEAALDAINEDIKIAQTNLSYANITAPFDGIVCDVPIDPGDLASPGKKLMVFENQNQLKVIVQFPQIDMKYVHLGDKLTVICGKKELEAEISKIYPALGENRMMKVEAVLNPENKNGFISGQYVKVSLTADTIHDVLIVPSSSINIDNCEKAKKALFVLKNGELKKVNVKILGDNEKEAAISGALHTGDKVVVSAYLGWAELADGLKAEDLGAINKPPAKTGQKQK